MRFVCIFLMLITAFAIKAETTQTPTPTTHEFKLENGLKLIVQEDHRAPLVVTQVWYKVGSSFEPNGLTGISHVLEHMMFRGTAKYPDNTFSRLIAIGGGDQNAFTSHDFTAYFQELDASRLALCFELEADRMMNLTLPSESFKQEIKVVMEERRLRTDDNPEMLTYERLSATAHVSNPYHHPVVGWMNDLENLTVDDVRDWYKMWYGPNNATVIVVGDVNPEAVFELAKTHFGPLKPITLPVVKPRKEVSQIGGRAVQVNANATVPRFFMSYNAPSIKTTDNPKECYALLTLLMALDGGDSGRFSKNLIRNKALMTSVFSDYDPFALHETLLMFTAVPTQNHTLSDVKAGLLDEIEQIKKTPLSDSELKRIKTNAIANHLYKKDSMSEKAIELGALESLGLSWQLADNFPKQIEAVTAEDVLTVANKYLTPERLTTADLIPAQTGH